MPKELIFVVEDDVSIRELVEAFLSKNGYRVKAFDTGESLLLESNCLIPDLFIIDILLPGIDGFNVCLYLRKNAALCNIPIIFLTVKSDEIEKILGFEIGGDDYITKPFSVRELNARIKAIFRRQNSLKDNSDSLQIKNLIIDFPRMVLFKNNELVELSYKEFEILKLFVLNKRKVLSREIILQNVWGIDYCGDTRTVDVHIRYLRKKIEDQETNPKYIETIRGMGYRFNDIW